MSKSLRGICFVFLRDFPLLLKTCFHFISVVIERRLIDHCVHFKSKSTTQKSVQNMKGLNIFPRLLELQIKKQNYKWTGAQRESGSEGWVLHNL